MDQLLIFYAITPKSTLKIMGVKQTSVKTLAGTKSQATVAITVAASGKMLQELVVFKASKKEEKFGKNLEAMPPSIKHKAFTPSNPMHGWTRT